MPTKVLRARRRKRQQGDTWGIMRIREFAVIAALVVLTGCAGLDDTKPPQVALSDMRMLQGTLFEQRFELDLRIRNPNDFDLPIDGLTFALELNGSAFADGVSNERVTVPRLGEAVVPVTASTTLVNMVQQAMRLGQRADLDYRLSGDVYLAGLARRAVPYERSGRLQLLPESGGGTSGDFGRTLIPM